ncbi:MAG: hypothetical protein AB1649_08025 [Chloroflexota bacterium]
MNLRTDIIPLFSSRLSYTAVKDQIVKILPAATLSVFISLGGAAVTVLVARLTDNPIWKLAKDPAEVMGFPAYIGMLSNWGTLLWISTAAICLFSAVILKQHNASASTARFIAFSGLISLFLGLDDIFRLHDNILPRLFHARERTFYILYFLIILAYLISFLSKILERDYLLLGGSIFLFAISRRMFIPLPYFDQFMTTGDMLKYFGIVFWLAFFYRTSMQEVSGLMKAKQI